MRMRLSGRLLDLCSRVTISAAAFLYAAPARAAGSSMPWEAPLQSILESIEGPVA
ncbi:MAG: TrbC/VirB2 family protein, partial [bacterium]|nr:TrbC/VirB2 family protein [bacterium]